MNLIAIILLILTGGWMAIEDWQKRSITTLSLFFFATAALFYHYYSPVTYWDSLINFGFLFVQYILLVCYFSIKNRSWEPIIDNYLGLGDVLFYLISVLLFPYLVFPIYWLSSLVIGLFLRLFLLLSYEKKADQIPFITAGVIPLIVLLIIDFFQSGLLENTLTKFVVKFGNIL